MSDNITALCVLVAVLVVGGLVLTYSIGNDRGKNIGASIMRSVMEQDAVNHGCAEYYFQGSEAKWRWKK